jgi:hypothetical protein
MIPTRYEEKPFKEGEYFIQGKVINEELSRFNGFASYDGKMGKYGFRFTFDGYEIDRMCKNYDQTSTSEFEDVARPIYKISLLRPHGKEWNELWGVVGRQSFYEAFRAYLWERFELGVGDFPWDVKNWEILK